MSGRFDVVEAAGELGVVQDLLNTAAVPKNRTSSPDLLEAPGTAAAWLSSVGAPLDESGLRDLQALRDALRRGLVRRDHDPAEPDPDTGITAAVRMRLDGDGTVTLTPEREDGLRERILLAVYTAQLTGTWSRLKICRNPDCRVAFWDSSRNSSAVWHNSRTCGNVTNLRNSRARRREAGVV